MTTRCARTREAEYTDLSLGLKFLPWALPGLEKHLRLGAILISCLIIAVADDLTEYWYHCLHHEVRWLWRFHRTGMAVASRQNLIIGGRQPASQKTGWW